MPIIWYVLIFYEIVRNLYRMQNCHIGTGLIIRQSVIPNYRFNEEKMDIFVFKLSDAYQRNIEYSNITAMYSANDDRKKLRNRFPAKDVDVKVIPK